MLVTAIAVEDQDRLHARTMQCGLQPIRRKRKTTRHVDWTSYGWPNLQWRIAVCAAPSLAWRNCRRPVAERHRIEEHAATRYGMNR